MQVYWHRIAAHLGMPVWEAKRRIPLPEFWEWIAYERVEPFDWGYCLIAAAIQATATGKQTDPMDFSQYGRRAPRTMEDMMAEVQMQGGATRTTAAQRTE